MAAYGKLSSFRSCPAATGTGRPPCPHFPDGAHRCGEERDHVRVSTGHACTCRYGWISATINDGRIPINDADR